MPWFVPHPYEIASTVVLLAGTAGLSTGLAFALGWPSLRLPLIGLAPALGLVLLKAAEQQSSPLQDAGWIAWPVGLLISIGALRYDESGLPRKGRRFAHTTFTWLFSILLIWTLADMSSRLGSGTAWPWAGALAGFGILLAVLASRTLQRRWPAHQYRLVYRWYAPMPIACMGFILLLIAPWVSSGDAAPFSYIPLVNPLDLSCILAAFGLLRWLNLPYVRSHLATSQAAIQVALGLELFSWLNSQLARAFYHFDDLPFNAWMLWQNGSYQAALALLWTLSAVTVMLIAKHKQRRALWLTGAALIGATVLKLFLVDLSGASSVARIVSFIGVGLLLVIIGYLAPAPTASQDATGDQ